MAWFTLAQVSVESGSKIVRVNSGESIATIYLDDGFQLDQFNQVNISNAYVEDVTGDSIIELAIAWAHDSQVNQSATIIPNAANLNASIQILTATNADIYDRLSSYILFGEQASGTVTFKAFGVGNEDVTVRCINQYKTDLNALESQVSGSVDDVALIDAQVNGVGGLVEVVATAVTDLSNISTSLQAFYDNTSDVYDATVVVRNTTEGYRNTAESYMNNALSYKNATENFYNSIDTWQSQVDADKGAATDARDLAKQYRDEAEAFKDQTRAIAEGDFVTTATKVNGKELSGDITLDATDIGIQTALDEIEALAIIGL